MIYNPNYRFAFYRSRLVKTTTALTLIQSLRETWHFLDDEGKFKKEWKDYILEDELGHPKVKHCNVGSSQVVYTQIIRVNAVSYKAV